MNFPYLLNNTLKYVKFQVFYEDNFQTEKGATSIKLFENSTILVT